MNAQTLLDTLDSLGVTVSAAGGKLRLEPAQRVPAELLPDLRAYKPDLLALLERPGVVTRWAEPTSPDTPNTPKHPRVLECLPASLEPMVRAAANDALPSTLTALPSGLVLDLNAYTLRWCALYLIGDRDEASRRLLEVYASWRGVRR